METFKVMFWKSKSTIWLYFFGLNRYEWSKDDFELGGALGKGKFGRVYVSREKKTHFMVAMKIMFKSELTNGRVEKQVLREIEIQSRLKWVLIPFLSFEHKLFDFSKIIIQMN